MTNHHHSAHLPAHLRHHQRSGTSSPSEKQSASRPTILFTGNRCNNHFEILIRGKAVKLRLACLKALMALVVARASSGQGFIQLSSVTVCRLRRAMDQILGKDAGKTLIETGSSNEYRLNIASNQLNGDVAFTPCFAELADRRVIALKDMARLQDALSIEIHKKSTGNPKEIAM